MADNVTLNPMTGGVSVAADDVGGVLFQRVKVTFGADGAASDASAATPLPVAIPATASVVGAISANAQTVVFPVGQISNLTVSMATSSLAGHAASFEFSNDSTDGSNGTWYSVLALRTNANTIESATGTLAATPAYGWRVSVNGFKYFRIRATAHTSGTATYTIQPGLYATEPVPAAQVSGTQAVSGTITNTPVTATSGFLNSAATTNGTVVKAAAGTLFAVTASNNGAAAAYLKLHNSTSVTAGTTAVAAWYKIPAGDAISVEFGAIGLRFGTGICFSITGAVADSDTTAVASGQVKVVTSYV